MTNIKAFGRITDVVTMNIEVVIKVLFIVDEIANHMAKTVAEMIMLIETIMISMRNANLHSNDLQPQPYKLRQLVSSKQQK